MNAYRALRPLLFALPPELAHGLTLRGLSVAHALPGGPAMLRRLGGAADAPLAQWGLRFANRVGVAAGLDKDATAWRGLLALGFGHVEVGTVTPAPQPGAAKPRVFRLVRDAAIVNRLGFPSQGAAAVRARLHGFRPASGVLGVNLGKNRDTPLERADEDYHQLATAFAPVADYLTINVSSPNTPGLRSLQRRDALERLLRATRQARDAARPPGRTVPLWVKLSPDLDDAALDEATGAILAAGADAIVATNTTRARPALRDPRAAEQGGLSGAPLRPQSLALLRRLAARTEGRLPLVAVGGISRPEHVREALDEGAILTQLYTALVYQGPTLLRHLTRPPTPLTPP